MRVFIKMIVVGNDKMAEGSFDLNEIAAYYQVEEYDKTIKSLGRTIIVFKSGLQLEVMGKMLDFRKLVDDHIKKGK